jgi:uncharacterized protein with PQ loop repeat
MDIDLASNVISILSIFFYSIVYFPQFYTIFKTKSADGVSVYMVIIWNQADVLSLVATILLQLPLSLVIIGWYHMIIGVFMTMYVLYFKRRRHKYDIVIIVSVIIVNILCPTFCTLYALSNSTETAGGVISWITMCMYILGRFPQVILNIKNKSTKDLSVLMYVFTIIANIFYLVLIFMYPDYIMDNLPWVISTVLTIFLDFFVVGQCYYYKRVHQITPISVGDEIVA